MGIRPLVAAGGVTAAFAVPAAVVASIGPHTSVYEQHPGSGYPGNNVALIVHHDTGKADLFVSNFCLGVKRSSGIRKEAQQAIARGVRVHQRKILYTGNATITTAMGPRKITMRFGASIRPKTAVGTARFANKRCSVISYKAKLTQRTK